MKKKPFIFTAILMSIALIGIVFTQIYLIGRTLSEKRQMTRLNINNALKDVANTLRESEVMDFISFINGKVDSIQTPPISEITDLYVTYSGSKNHSLHYRHRLREEDYGNYTFKNKNTTDSIPLKKIVSDRFIIFNNQDDLEGSENKTFKIKNNTINEIDKAFFSISYKDILTRLPIETRFNKEKVEFVLDESFINHNIDDFKYEYAILDKGSGITKIASDSYTKFSNLGCKHSVVLFKDNEQYPEYTLKVVFPNETHNMIYSMVWTYTLSILFTGIIIVVYFLTLYQFFNQKRLSDMKNDFINNMTHEFKTPIATISLALDTLRKTMSQKKANDVTVNKFTKIIKEENNRMNYQVEDILNLSRLEKNGNRTISKEVYDINKIVEKAIGHIELIVRNKNGKITLDLGKFDEKVYVAEDYIVSALVNILDNAIKYSNELIEIKVKTILKNKHVCISIEDRGLGMTKKTIKHIFKKFYREPTGNIHNVKGHGIGLAFVKYVLEVHDAKVKVISELNKGSIFIIDIPILK